MNAIAVPKQKYFVGPVHAIGATSVDQPLSPLAIGFYVIDTASMALCAYHGYKRNNSVGWAIAWGLMGTMFPIIAPVIAFAEGFAKPIQRTAKANKRRGRGKRARR